MSPTQDGAVANVPPEHGACGGHKIRGPGSAPGLCPPNRQEREASRRTELPLTQNRDVHTQCDTVDVTATECVFAAKLRIAEVAS